MDTRFTIDGREYVDMGTGVLWATCNLGANAPEEQGHHFAFGETAPKEKYSLNNYVHGDYCYDMIMRITWNSIDEFGDNSDANGNGQYGLLSEYDAATVILGDGHAIPSHDDFSFLLRSCDKKVDTLNGVMGLSLTSRITGENLFLPMAKSAPENIYYEDTPYGEYYCSTGYYDRDELYGEGLCITPPYILSIAPDELELWDEFDDLWVGRSIRPIYYKPSPR